MPMCATIVTRCEAVNLDFEPIIFERLGGLEQGARDLLVNLYDRIDECYRYGMGSSFQEYLDYLISIYRDISIGPSKPNILISSQPSWIYTNDS